MVEDDDADRRRTSSDVYVGGEKFSVDPQQMPEFSDRLQIALDVRDMSQHALARATGIAQGAISNLVRGKRDDRIGFAMVMRIARALRVNPIWLGEGTGPVPTELDRDEERLPQLAAAIRLWREAGREEHAVRRVESDALTDAHDLSTVAWIEQLQYAARLRPTAAPPTPPTESIVRPRADISPPTRRSSPLKKP